MNLIATLEQEEINKMNQDIPNFNVGDTIIVNMKVKEGNKERIQAFEGVVIARNNRGYNSNFIVRKMSSRVERTLLLYNPNIDSIKIVRKGAVRRAKLYYLRQLQGKAARIKEKLTNR